MRRFKNEAQQQRAELTYDNGIDYIKIGKIGDCKK